MLNYRHVGKVWLDAATKLASPPRGISLSWYPQLSRILGGLRPGELTLFCAPTGAGKTQFLANLSAQLVFQGESVFVAPVETGDSDFLIRALSALEKKDYNTNQEFSPECVRQLSKRHSHTVLEKQLYIATYDNRVPVQEMADLLSLVHQEHNVTIAVLDNLNFFLDTVSSQMERAEMDNAIHTFRMLTQKIPIHIILVVHPRKTPNGRVDSEFDVKGSSTAAQEAFNVILFNRPTPEDIASGKRHRTDREMQFPKIRNNGTAVGDRLWFSFSGGRFSEIK